MGQSGWRTDGFNNGLQLYAVTHFGPLWRLLRRTPIIGGAVNSLIINQLVYKMKTRPAILSTKSDYTSWDSLTDREFSQRHLRPDPAFTAKLPPSGKAADLFRRADGDIFSTKSTLLFSHFAQWFVDGFLRTDPADPLKNTSTHDIDLSQLYGQCPEMTCKLRTKQGGRLKSQEIGGGEYPPYLFGPDGKVKPEFVGLDMIYPGSDRKMPADEPVDLDDRQKFFALALPRGNIHYGLGMFSTLFLREHNRIAKCTAAKYPCWDDEQVFQTTRNTMIVLLIKIVVEDYINHITPFHFKLFYRPGIGINEKWYRQNWMSIEFNLLYRWHALVPSTVRLLDQERDMASVRWKTDFVHERGIGALIDESSRQPSTEIGLRNTAGFLLKIEEESIDMGRAANLRSFNEYRASCGYPELKSFDQLTSDPELRTALADCYSTIDDVELYVGLFAEDVRTNAALPTLMGTMVAVDAFSQALTNPLLAPEIFNEKDKTFGEPGWQAIQDTDALADIVLRNIGGEAVQNPLVTFTQQDWTPS